MWRSVACNLDDRSTCTTLNPNLRNHHTKKRRLEIYTMADDTLKRKAPSEGEERAEEGSPAGVQTEEGQSNAEVSATEGKTAEENDAAAKAKERLERFKALRARAVCPSLFPTFPPC